MTNIRKIIEKGEKEKKKLNIYFMKTLKISEELHKEVKVFCATNGLKMNDWVEKELKKILNEYDSNRESSSKGK